MPTEEPTTYLSLDARKENASHYVFVDSDGVVRGVKNPRKVIPRSMPPEMDVEPCDWPIAHSDEELAIAARKNSALAKIIEKVEKTLDDFNNVAVIGPEAPILALLLFMDEEEEPEHVVGVTKRLWMRVRTAIQRGVIEDGEEDGIFGCTMRVNDSDDFSADGLNLGTQPLLCKLAKMRPPGSAMSSSLSSTSSSAAKKYKKNNNNNINVNNLSKESDIDDAGGKIRGNKGKGPKPCASDCQSVAHYNDTKLVEHINAFALTLPPVNDEDMDDRGGYPPASVREFWKTRFNDPHPVAAWSAIRRVIGSSRTNLVFRKTIWKEKRGVRRFELRNGNNS